MKYNFYSGPAMLPAEVVEKSTHLLTDFAGTGIGIMEISHRSKEFVALMEEARALSKKLMNLSDDFEVLFLQGGGSLQFSMVPMNFLNENETASYFDTGQWAHTAIKEAELFGKVHIACSSADSKYNHIPKTFDIHPQSKYLHITTNNTIYGTRLKDIPETNVPLIADMSSDILSRDIDFNRFALIYASAQKNIGPAGITLVAVNKNYLSSVNRSIPAMLDYRTHIKKESMHNTPPTFSVAVCLLTLQWIERNGLQAIEKQNEYKASLLYDAIDESSLFETMVSGEDRSRMNVCFRMKDENAEDSFLKRAKEAGVIGIKGYRTVGGFRASIYNAMPVEGVKTLIEVMKETERVG